MKRLQFCLDTDLLANTSPRSARQILLLTFGGSPCLEKLSVLLKAGQPVLERYTWLWRYEWGLGILHCRLPFILCEQETNPTREVTRPPRLLPPRPDLPQAICLFICFVYRHCLQPLGGHRTRVQIAAAILAPSKKMASNPLVHPAGVQNSLLGVCKCEEAWQFVAVTSDLSP